MCDLDFRISEQSHSNFTRNNLFPLQFSISDFNEYGILPLNRTFMDYIIALVCFFFRVPHAATSLMRTNAFFLCCIFYSVLYSAFLRYSQCVLEGNS